MGDYVVQQGVTEQRAAEIADQQARLVLAEYTKEAADVASARIEKLDARVVGLLSDEGKLDALQEPAYQIALKKAQMGAASTEREGDYDLLARLLGQRANQDSRFVRASIDRAVQVVDMIDDAALQGLNMLWVVSTFTPGGDTLETAIRSAEGLLGLFPRDKLPTGRRWLDHLDMIDLVRVTPGGLTTLRKFVQFFSEKWRGHLSVGVERTVAAEIQTECQQRGVEPLRVVEHELKPEYYRLPYQSTEHIRRIMTARQVPDDDIEFLIALARDKGKVDVLDESLVPRLEEAIAASPVLAEIRTWWDQVPDYPLPTSAGITIAYANSRRFHDFENVYGVAEYLEQSI